MSNFSHFPFPGTIENRTADEVIPDWPELANSRVPQRQVTARWEYLINWHQGTAMAAFSGAWPALVTPFTSENTVNVVVLSGLAEFFIEKGVGGLYLCGSTGQGIFMSMDEHKLIVEAALDQVRGRIPVIVQVGSVALHDAVDLAPHAQQSGADGISSTVPPLYRDAQGLKAYFAALAAM